MINIDAIEEATEVCLERGLRVLNAWLLAEDEAAHARRLLELIRAPEGAVVLDAGCGVGELARLMADVRPDLRWKLLNVSMKQLAHCPDGMDRICAPFEATGLPDASVDVVLFAFSLCHAADWLTVLREAYRVLKPGGTVFIFDMGRTDSGNGLMRELLQGDAYRPAEIVDVARRAGLELDQALMHVPTVQRLREVFEAEDNAAAYDLAFKGVIPITLRLSRMPYAPEAASAFARHQRVGFQLSGGRDSIAALHVLEAYWDRMDVYFLDTGEHFPETLEVIAAAERMLGKPVIRIASSTQAVREEFGLASDVVPVDNTPLGRLVSGRAVKIIGRYECCGRSLMQPMHQRMLADGITLIVRGQRDADYASPPKRSGDVEGGVEVLYPIQSWSTAQVDAYLQRHGLPVAGFYAGGMPHGSDCMGCTAWWGEGRDDYLSAHYPQAFEVYRERMRVIRIEIDRQYATLGETKKESCHG